jgi:hypothetical protein
VDPHERLPRDRAAELLPQEPVEGAEAQRAQREQAHVGQAGREPGPGRRAPPSGDEDRDTTRQATQGEEQRVRRVPVEPLCVVDRDEDRRVLRQQLERRADGDGDRPAVDTAGRLLREQQSPAERRRARRRQPLEHVLAEVLEQVAEARVRERALRLCRSGAHDREAGRVRPLQRGRPQRRLADPRLAADHQRDRRRALFAQERLEPLELLLASHQVSLHRPRGDADKLGAPAQRPAPRRRRLRGPWPGSGHNRGGP